MTSTGPHASHYDAAYPPKATGTSFPQPDFASHEPQREHPFVKAGVGIRFGVDKDMKVQIIDLFQGSPAQTSGQLDVGDILVSIDGVLVSGLSSQEINSLIVGPPGTTVTLEVRRGDMIHTARIQRRANATPTSTPSR
jgi:C-terminal processing protease CtpA/Prc